MIVDKKQLLSLLQPEIERINEAMAAEFADIQSSRLAKVVDYGIFNGGKRIRPLLTVLIARLVAFTRMPEGIADSVLYLASDLSGRVTGVALVGGLLVNLMQQKNN